MLRAATGSSTSRWATAAASHENRGLAGLVGQIYVCQAIVDRLQHLARLNCWFCCSSTAPILFQAGTKSGFKPPTCEATPPPESFNPNVDIDKPNYNGSLHLRGLARGPADRPARPTRAGQDPLASCQNCFEKNLGSDPVAPRHSNSARSLAHCQLSAPACQRSG